MNTKYTTDMLELYKGYIQLNIDLSKFTKIHWGVFQQKRFGEVC